MSPETTKLLIIGGILYLLHKQNSNGSAEPSSKPAPAAGGGGPKVPASSLPGNPTAPAPVGSYVSRANQPQALAWDAAFQRAGASPQIAAGLCRWAGIESGGNPLAKSSLSEVGLLQITPATAKAVFTDAEFKRINAPLTDREEHARLALKQFKYHLSRVATYAAVPQDAESQLFYAKLHHQRPVMVQDAWKSAKTGGLTAWPQARIAARLAGPSLTQTFQKNYLRAASVVGWGAETP